MKNNAPLIIAVSVFAAVAFGWNAMIALYIIFGQDVTPTLVLVNNSKQGLTVTSAGPPIPVAASTVTEAPFAATTPMLAVTTADGHTWKYTWAPLGWGYEHGHKIYLQVEADGAIYVMPGEVTGVSTSLPAQPTGYPLKPQ